MAIKYFVYGIQIFDSSIQTSSHFKDVLLFGSEKMAKNRAEQINVKAAHRLATEVAVVTNMQEINVTKEQHDLIARKRNGVWQHELTAMIKEEMSSKRAETEKLRTTANQLAAALLKQAADAKILKRKNRGASVTKEVADKVTKAPAKKKATVKTKRVSNK